MRWLPFILFFTTLSVWAKDPLKRIPEDGCKPSDLTSKFPPIRDQGPRIGWCYGVTGADLLSEASGLLKENEISLLDMGGTYISASSSAALKSLKFIHQWSKTDPERAEANFMDHEFSGQSPAGRRGGVTTLAMALYLSQDRICSERLAPSQGSTSESKGLTLSKAWKLHDQTGEKSMTFIEKEILERSKLSSSSDEHAEEPGAAIVHNCVASSAPLLKPALVRAIYNLATKEFKKSLDNSCRTAPPFPAAMQIESSDNDGNFHSKLDELLKRDIPVGIGYDYCGLSKKRMPGPCPHESIIVGRRFSAGSCQYLVRNSHGPNCDIYQEMNVECDQTHPGYYWVNEKSLDPLVEDFTWVETDKNFFGKTTSKPLF